MVIIYGNNISTKSGCVTTQQGSVSMIEADSLFRMKGINICIKCNAYVDSSYAA